MANPERVAQAYREAFGDVRPATTMVEMSKSIDPAVLVEIEAEALLSQR